LVPAAALKLTAADLLELKVIDEVIPEPLGGAHQDHSAAIENLRVAVERQLDELRNIPIEKLLTSRYEKFPSLPIPGLRMRCWCCIQTACRHAGISITIQDL